MSDQLDTQNQPDDAAAVRSAEPDLLQGLLAAGDEAQNKTVKITIQRDGKVYFAFNVHALSEQEYNSIIKEATHYVQNKNLGVKVPEDRDDAMMRSLVIYHATVDADRKALWNNQAALSHFKVAGGIDLIDKVLLPGEKQAIVNKIDELSGYGTDLEETAKNLSTPEDGQQSSTTSSSAQA